MNFNMPNLNFHRGLHNFIAGENRNRIPNNPPRPEDHIRPLTTTEQNTVLLTLATVITLAAIKTDYKPVAIGLTLLLLWTVITGPSALDSLNLNIENTLYPAGHLDDAELKNRLSNPLKKASALPEIYNRLTTPNKISRETAFTTFMPALLKQANAERAIEAKISTTELLTSPCRPRTSTILERLANAGPDNIKIKLTKIKDLPKYPRLLSALSKQSDTIKLAILEKHGKNIIDGIKNNIELTFLNLLGQYSIEKFEYINDIIAIKHMACSGSIEVKQKLIELISEIPDKNFNLKTILKLCQKQ